MSYKARTLIPGWKIKHLIPYKLKDKDFIAVPEHRFNSGVCKIMYHSQNMRVTKDQSVCEFNFVDKHKKNKFYKLLYFQWVPDKELELF